MKKNVLLIMTDEQSWDTLGAHGNRAAKTPHLDQLVDRSVSFRNCYTPYPLCCPSRTSMWTGCLPHNHHVTGNWRHMKPELADEGLARPFGEAGYHTIYCGKWHIPGSTPVRFGFDDISAIPAVVEGRDRGRFIKEYREYATEQGYKLHPRHIENLTEPDLALLRQENKAPCGTAEIKEEHFLETWQTDRFIEALERRPEDRPFFAVCSYNAPHFPMIVPSPYDKLINPDEIELPESFYRGFADKPEEVRNSHYSRGGNLSEQEWRRWTAHYLGLCALIDTQVGKVMGYLREHGLEENTIVAFVSDHGDMMGAHKLVEKGYSLHYEEALRVPLLIADPDRKEGCFTDAFTSLIDVLPTLADLAGVRIDRAIDGVSQRAAVSGQSEGVREYVFAETYKFAGEEGGAGEYTNLADFTNNKGMANFSIRNRNGKYIFRWSGEEEYYDLLQDPHEMNNVADLPAYALQVKAMQELILKELADAPQSLRLEVEKRIQTC